MTLLYSSETFLWHETGSHPEHAGRLREVSAHLAATGLQGKCRQPNWQPISRQRVAAVHGLDYVDHLQQVCAAGGGRLDADTVASSQSYDVALLAAGAVCNAVERVVAGEDTQALCLVRPPGHHALHDTAMGFCLLNNIALGARVATGGLGLDRVMIVDWDVHHGNGTQATFWEDPQVGFLSIHRWPFYPGTGRANETGAGDALGTTLNLPIEFGTSRDRYLSQFARALDDFATRIKPELILISAGFDSHREDPVGSLGLETADFAYLTAAVLDVAAAHCEGRVVSVLEGGYNPQRLAESVATHLEELLDRQAGSHA